MMDQVLVSAAYLFCSVWAMICVAIFGYFMAQMWVEATDASKIQSSTTPDGSGSRPGPVWEVHSDWDEREETRGDGEEA